LKSDALVDLYAILTAGGRNSGEKSRALPQQAYGDPARFVKFGKRKGGEVDRQSDQEKADTLLMEWYRWTRLYRPKLGYPGIAPYCHQFSSSNQYDDPADLTHDKAWEAEMRAVDFCVGALAVSMQQAIGTEMRNREANAKVWRSPSNRTYAEALAAILSVMRKRGLFD
jgi:hypothetical protein